MPAHKILTAAAAVARVELILNYSVHQCHIFDGLFSPLGKPADRAIYILLALISSLFFMFFLLGAKLSQYLLDRFS